MEKKIYTISKYVLTWTIIVLLICIMTGCAKENNAVNDAATTAHETISTIKQSLPKECQTKAIDQQLKTADASVDAIVSACELQKEEINQERQKWKWAFFALTMIVAFHIGRKVVR